MYKISILAIAIVFMASCSATRVVKPLEKGEKRLSASVGGPAILFSGAPMPLPLSSVCYAQGVDSTVSAFGAIHITDAVFGVIHLEGGMAIKSYENESKTFGVTITPSFHVMGDVPEANIRTYPQLESLVWRCYGERMNYFYGGLGTWIELNKVKAHAQVQRNELLPWVVLGNTFVRNRWSYTIEARYLGFQHRNDNIVVDYISPSNRGALGVYFGFARNITKP